MKHMLKCSKCSKYTLKSCCGSAFAPKPAKFSPEDAYGTYRRKVKYKLLKEKSLL
ncbi:ribosome biogenesis protein [Candidatus Woesearchaeota archaeon]|nr:ribosome biogenesis protein [Candidatus Woesearchaeota archaeon]|tara:strand:- start:22080 stop:22244 length:165 start_codon:yes stop_codon:yes gene_type:complete